VTHTVLFLTAFLLSTIAIAGFERDLSPRSLEEAVVIGQSRFEAEWLRFHLPYRIEVRRPPVDYIEVITPFRRVVLAANTRARSGGRMFGQRDARDALGSRPQQLDLIVELTFHPLNTYIGVPAYEVALFPADAGADAKPVDALDTTRVPRHGPRLEAPLSFPYRLGTQLPGGSDSLRGGTLLAQFDDALLDSTGTYDVIVSEAKKELARARIDLGKMR
jgi:hypothetical protein